MATNVTDPPYTALSTAQASYCEAVGGTSGHPDDWQRVIVVVAELTPKTNCLLVCPVLECELAPWPLRPMVQLLFPEDDVIIVSCNEETGDIGFRHVDNLKGRTSTFTLRFESRLEFWDCMQLISNVQSAAEARRDDLMFRMSQALESVPCHNPQTARALCSNPAHAQSHEDMPTDP